MYASASCASESTCEVKSDFRSKACTQAARATQGFPGLPPIDGKSFLRRKNNFLSLTTWETAEKLLQVRQYTGPIEAD